MVLRQLPACNVTFILDQFNSVPRTTRDPGMNTPDPRFIFPFGPAQSRHGVAITPQDLAISAEQANGDLMSTWCAG
jgi:hypothetical protein